MSEQHPVTVAVRRADGGVEQVRVGWATRTAEGFSLELGELTIGAVPVAVPRAAAAAPRASGGGGGGMSFPNYGRSMGASMQDLEYYASGCKRTLNDPAKSRWHDKERELLAAIEAEIARQGGGGGGSGGGSSGGDWGAAPRTAEPAWGSSGLASEPPPFGDEDIPF
ncbi:MAG: hypothetical protein RL199_436 [Pseudomonadota bacterium]|jgi:hypothetical protein